MNFSSLLHLQPPSYERKKHYDFGRDLGTGTYGTVKQAKSKDTGEDVAIKIILKKTVKGHEEMVEKEIGVLRNLNHPNIVNFLDWFESRDKYYLVFDLASGGELFDRICDQGRFTENNAATIMKEVINAIEYLHGKNVVHRDLKPENLLYKDNTMDSPLMIVDFGYAAPEVLLRKGHGKPVDMWSIGLCGYAPFQAETDQQLVGEIARCNVVFHERYWRDVSVEARDFIKCLLRANPDKRLTATEALQHKWITTETGSDVDLLDNVKEGFNAKKMFRKTVRAVAAANRLRNLTRYSTDVSEAPLSGATSPPSSSSSGPASALASAPTSARD
ncbi:hypothetical protein BGW38_000488 [Lunasporangiospora selenospora]|uniref:Protein kinase domain-containing protein n=1 Tax=Lunasporangiospora selenospora TaxID=979761 RepID=A0A9P6KEX5_9FUNG|nr:hypothetical protein BGW38_000488 [Lunasporangiospora selenospora]